MGMIFGPVLGVLVVAGFIVGLYAWAKLVYFMSTLPRNKKPEVPWSAVPWGSLNRFNIVVTPQHLTDQGKRNLRELMRHLALFIAAVGVPLLVGALLSAAHLI